jgi:hypothetical protein
MEALICKAWRAYDDSDAKDVPIDHEEAVLARYCVDRQREMRETLERVLEMAVRFGAPTRYWGLADKETFDLAAGIIGEDWL